MKLTNRSKKHLNISINLLLHIQHNQNTPILVNDNDKLDYFIYHKEEKYLLGNKKQKQNNKEDQKNFLRKSSNNASIRDMLLGR